LRKRWQDRWPTAEHAALARLADTYRQRGIHWGVGLSPFALYRDYGPSQKLQLKQKLHEIQDLGEPLIALLFDDMPGEVMDLAARQADIVCDVLEWQRDDRLLMCPTYYSYDSVLETHFGKRPEAYWDELGAALPPEVDVFWTGNKVCSDTIQASDLEEINTKLRRQVVLWDNYPVNDGAERSNFLYMEPLPGRSPDIKSSIRGHLCNPMNQGLLSLPAFAGLASLHHRGAGQNSWLAQALGVQTWQLLQRDGARFQSEGLLGLGQENCINLATEYAELKEPGAAEVAAWLRGEYTFDPACLTD